MPLNKEDLFLMVMVPLSSMFSLLEDRNHLILNLYIKKKRS